MFAFKPAEMHYFIRLFVVISISKKHSLGYKNNVLYYRYILVCVCGWVRLHVHACVCVDAHMCARRGEREKEGGEMLGEGDRERTECNVCH